MEKRKKRRSRRKREIKDGGGITHDDAGQKDSIGVVDVGGIEEPQNGSGSTPKIAKTPCNGAARRNRGESAPNEMIFQVKRSNDANDDAAASTSARCRQEVKCDAGDAVLFSSLFFLSLYFFRKETTSRHPLSSICFRRRRRRWRERERERKEKESGKKNPTPSPIV